MFPQCFPVSHTGNMVSSVCFCFQDANYACATRQEILSRIRACEHFQKFFEHEQASTHLIFASNSSNGQILRALSSYMGPFDTPYFWPAKFYQPCIITISEPQYLLFYSADCKCTAVIRQRLEMPHFSIVTKISTTQRLTRGESVLRLFNILGGIHSKLENYGFHKQNFDYYRF